MSDRLDEEALYALTLGLPPVQPPEAVRGRILSAVSQTSRFERFADKIAQMIDVGVDAVRGFLAKIDDAAAWEPGPPPSRLIHLPHGPRLVQVDVGFVHVPAGGNFPRHRHLGDEHVFILQGSCLDSDGSIVRAGETAFQPAGSTHSFSVPAGPDLVYLVVLRQGVEIEGFGTITVA